MMNFTDKKVGIVLSGGGAKGAYQVGMFRALEEAGLSKKGLILAGTSIGALGSIVYALSGADGLRKAIQDVGKVYTGELPLDEYFNETMPLDALAANPIPVTVCAYSQSKMRPEYFLLNHYAPEEQRILTMASCALPDIIPPVPYGGDLYSDGGIVPSEENFANAAKQLGIMLPSSFTPADSDKIPAIAVQNEDIDIEIVSYLEPYDKIDDGLWNPKAMQRQCTLRRVLIICWKIQHMQERLTSRRNRLKSARGKDIPRRKNCWRGCKTAISISGSISGLRRRRAAGGDFVTF